MTYPTPDDIAAAADRITGRVRRTPILEVEAGALGLSYPVTLKLEHTQVTGSFKVRGAFNNMLSREVPTAGVVAASGGNHGAAVAYAATELGHASRIYVPRAIAKEEKLRRMRMFGGEVILTEGSVADCMAEYAAAAESSGALSVHPYDTVLDAGGSGHGRAGIESRWEGRDRHTILVATGGGGLIGGSRRGSATGSTWSRSRPRAPTRSHVRSARGPKSTCRPRAWPRDRLAARGSGLTRGR
jgi:threonine dehydratase